MQAATEGRGSVMGGVQVDMMIGVRFTPVKERFMAVNSLVCAAGRGEKVYVQRWRISWCVQVGSGSAQD